MELRAPYLPSPEDPPASVAPEYRPPARFVDYWDWARIQDDRDGVKTGRLAPWLREAAQTRDPMAILRRAVVARFRPRTADAAAESQALADLAVTGRVAFTRFRSMRPRDELLLSAVRTELSSIDPSALGATVREVLDRAYNVAWALRGSPTQRRDLRPGLGWIAVSSEDDSPHAPTNVSCTTDHMGELALSVGRSAQVVTLRASIKLPMEPATVPLPPIAERRVPAPTDLIDALFLRRSTAGYDELFLFVHGLGSRLEESETFKRNLIDLGLARGRRYAVLSVDMPGMGYSSRLDIDNLITRRVRGHHGFNLPNGVGSNFPLLGLYRDTLVEICNRFRVQYVMGGSLGGNMTLWLAAEPMFTDLDPSRGQPSSVMSFLSWSPASIWESYERSRDTPVEGNGTHMDIGKNGAKKTSMGRMSERETEGRRWEFFEKMQRGEEILGLHILGAWGYPPTQDGLLLQSELYNEQYRRTFWTAAYEQVTFSHQEPLTPSGRWPFQTIAKPLFLVGGARDVGDHGVMDIYNPVIAVSDRVRGVLGRRQLMLETEHGISDQRPRHLAEQIVDFIGSLNSRWGHLSPDTAHPFHADVNCDLG
ncbi:MAG TPA: hypothetical protein DEA71_14305, partial [Nitrospira sp.]|nr:hypothetical protein [Nitrospira sp.]